MTLQFIILYEIEILCELKTCLLLYSLDAFQSVVGAIMEFLYFAIKHGKSRLYCRAKYDVLKNFSKMMIKRKAIMKKKRVNDKYIYSLIAPLWEKDFLKRKLKKIIYG